MVHSCTKLAISCFSRLLNPSRVARTVGRMFRASTGQTIRAVDSIARHARCNSLSARAHLETLGIYDNISSASNMDCMASFSLDANRLHSLTYEPFQARS